jgi:predicted CopG family antitoxin
VCISNAHRKFYICVCICVCMVKVISLSDEAYGTLRGMKGSDHSFSDVVLRLSRRKGDLMSLFGCAKEDKEFIKGLKKSSAERKKQSLRVY